MRKALPYFILLAVLSLAAQTINNGSSGAVGKAGGDLSGSYPNPTVAQLNTVPFCNGFTPSNGQVLQYTTGGSPNPCYTATTPVAQVYPIRAVLFAADNIDTAGSSLFYPGTTSSQQQLYGYAWSGNGGNGDTFTQSFLLAAGTYTFNVVGLTFNNKGKIDWYLDGTKFVTGQDWYSSAFAFNVVQTNTGVVVATSGLHVLEGVVNGKNSSSSAYTEGLTEMSFLPSAD